MSISRSDSFILKTLERLHLLGAVNTTTRLRLNGRVITIPLMGGVGMQNLVGKEPWLDAYITELLELKSGAFLDVGINLGQTLLKFLRHGGNQAYYGFEPNARCCTYVEELARINRLENVHIIPVGLSDHTEIRKLYYREPLADSASMIEGFKAPEFYDRWSFVPVFRGDGLIEDLQIENIALIKVDVEGAEIEVLTGLRRTIASRRPFIVCEILPIYGEKNSLSQLRRQRTDAVVAMMHELDYVIARIGSDGTPTLLDTIETHGDMNMINYLFIPQEHVDVVQRRLQGD